MALSAYDIEMRSFNSIVGGELIESEDWKGNEYTAAFYAGCNPLYNHNRVVVMRFTIDKHAKSVTIPIQAGTTNNSSDSVLLCYGLGVNPDTDDSMINITGSEKAMGTFYFSSENAVATITLNNVKAGTNFLYIWGQDSSAYSLTIVTAPYTIVTGITYEELEGLIYIDNGFSLEPYEIYIDNGTSWDLYIPYIDNGSNWDLCI